MFRKKLLGSQPSWITQYISSMDEDREIVGEVLYALKAHVTYLKEKGIIPAQDAIEILRVISNLTSNPKPLFKVEAEDIHEAIEIYLKQRLGDKFGWISLGKSRNDHVAAALRLHLKRKIVELLDGVLKLRRKIIEKAEDNASTIMIGFTHLQPAQPISFAHYLLHLEEELSNYFEIFIFILDEIVGKSPLGSAALAGSTVPLNRSELSRKISMNKIVVNTLTSTSSRDFITIASSIAVSLLVTLSRIAEDFIIWSTPQFNYIKPHPHHLSTSSIMPHKRNPVTMEILRASAGEAIGHLISILTIMKGLPSGYNLDLQEITKHCWSIFRKLRGGVEVLADFIEKVEVNKDAMRRDVEKFMLLTTDLTETLSMRLKIPYRTMHQIVAEAVKHSCNFKEVVEYLSNKLNLEIKLPVKIEEVLGMKKTEGSPNIEHVKNMISEAITKLRLHEKIIREKT